MTSTPAWTHWTLFGAALAGAGVLIAAAFWELHRAYQIDALTRQTLFESLVYLAGILALLWGAGWIVASRPRPLPGRRFEGYSYA